MPRKAEGLNIPTIWVAIVVQVVTLLFFAGVGWNRLSTTEQNITTINLKIERYDEVKERLVKLEITLASLATNVERIASRFEALSTTSRIIPDVVMPRKR